MKRSMLFLIAALGSVGCVANATTPSPGYEGTISVSDNGLTCQPNGAVFCRCTGFVRLAFSPAIKQGIELIVDVDSSSLNNGYYNQGPYVTPSDCDKPPCYWNSVVVRIGGDISYCPVQRRSVVNVSDYRTRRAMVNGIPVNWKGTCG